MSLFVSQGVKAMSVFKIPCEIFPVCEILTPEHPFKPQISDFYLVHIWNYHNISDSLYNLKAHFLFLLYEMSRMGKSLETESRLEGARALGWGERSMGSDHLKGTGCASGIRKDF